jgi:N-acetylmuramoyl-L-alanine amidase
MKRTLQPILPVATLLALALLGLWLARRDHTPEERNPPRQPADSRLTPLSPLAMQPDWSRLDPLQESVTRTEFESLLTTVFTTGGGWREHIELGPDSATILTGEPAPKDRYLLRFAKPGTAGNMARYWRKASEMPPAPENQPLAGIRIAIDPGHIGGSWARMEERRLQVGSSAPVMEGDMTLKVAQLLKPRLEKLGAEVTLVRKNAEPVTTLRPESLQEEAHSAPAIPAGGLSPRKLAEQLFYRTAEIRARADLVNERIRPDLLVCLHFNAEPWGNPDQPELTDRSHFHILLNGAYSDSELKFADQRYAMIRKLASGIHHEEAAVAGTVAEVFSGATQLPPFLYPPDAPNARPVNANSYLWARNLLANRLYDCPVLFMEPYVMNSTSDHPRMAAGDYGGTRGFNGRELPSIFREYADALTASLARHYSSARGNQNTPLGIPD